MRITKAGGATSDVSERQKPDVESGWNSR